MFSCLDKLQVMLECMHFTSIMYACKHHIHMEIYKGKIINYSI